MNESSFPVKGFISGTAEVRDKHGNLKGTFSFGGEGTSEDAAAITGKSVEHVENNLGKNLLGESNGSDTDHRRS